jgi:hypothetical protein
MGSFRQQMQMKGKPFICEVAVVAFLPKGSCGERYAMVRLDAPWETLEDDRSK